VFILHPFLRLIRPPPTPSPPPTPQPRPTLHMPNPIQPNTMSSYDVNLRLANDPDRNSFRSLDHFRLGSFAWDISLGNIRLWTFAWELSFDNFRLLGVSAHINSGSSLQTIYNEIRLNCLI
jgi:hypothetical protein